MTLCLADLWDAKKLEAIPDGSVWRYFGEPPFVWPPLHDDQFDYIVQRVGRFTLNPLTHMGSATISAIVAHLAGRSQVGVELAVGPCRPTVLMGGKLQPSPEGVEVTLCRYPYRELRVWRPYANDVPALAGLDSKRPSDAARAKVAVALALLARGQSND